MSAQPRETVQSLLAAAERGNRKACNTPERTFGERNGLASLSRGDDTSPGVLDGTSATSLPRYDDTTRTRPLATDERETTVSVRKEDEAVPPTLSVEINSATPLSQNYKRVVHFSVEDTKTVLLPQDRNAVDSLPPAQDNRATSSQAMVTAQGPGSIDDDSVCENKVCSVQRCWR